MTPADEALRAVTCCFTGHRLLAPEEREEAILLLDQAIASAWAAGYQRFYSGAALGIDTLAAQRVLLFQARHPEAELLLAVPCGNQSEKWPPEARRTHRRLCYGATEVRTLARAYYPGCMQVRNRYMVDRSSLCIAYLRTLRGGTLSTVRYALSQEVRVINLLVEGEV